MSSTDGRSHRVTKLIWQPLYEKIPDTDYRKKTFNDSEKRLNPQILAYANLKFFSGRLYFSADIIDRAASTLWLKNGNKNNDHDAKAQSKWQDESNDFRFQVPVKEIETGALGQMEQNS